MKKINFSAKTAKNFRTSANNEGKGMNHAIKAVKAVWDKENKDKELQDSIDSAKADGLTINDFSADFIKSGLMGTKFISADGQTILTNKKGEMVAKTTWTPGQVIDYVRRANRAKLLKENKENK